MSRPRVRDPRLLRALVALCVTEITSWGILYYALPVAAQDITATDSWSHAQVFTAFSAGLLLSAVAGAGVGRLLDRYGPRPVMTLGALVGVLGLLLVASAPSLPVFFAAWLVTGLAQSATLYRPRSPRSPAGTARPAPGRSPPSPWSAVSPRPCSPR